MGAKALWSIKLTNTLSISECQDGFWLYDYTRGMNLAMHAKTERDAFTEAITYYQKRTNELEEKFEVLNNSVQNFISSLPNED